MTDWCAEDAESEEWDRATAADWLASDPEAWKGGEIPAWDWREHAATNPQYRLLRRDRRPTPDSIRYARQYGRYYAPRPRWVSDR